MNLPTIHRHVNIFLNTSYVTLQQVKNSIELVFGSQLTLKDDNVDIKLKILICIVQVQ
jgi:hypothetical protein